jgi:hypothetical protein
MALCSIEVVKILAFFGPAERTKPFITTFRASVTFAQKVTFRGSRPGALKSSASLIRQSSTRFIAPRSRADDAPRARLAPPRVRNSDTASATHGGLGHVVAALFR